ncbi:unnamed protein product [Caenorhabditis brenneri]
MGRRYNYITIAEQYRRDGYRLRYPDDRLVYIEGASTKPQSSEYSPFLMCDLQRDLEHGFNTIQIYLKGPGCRTFDHWENSGLASINIGPDDCVCSCFARMASSRTKYLSGHWIPFYKFVQKPGQGEHVAVVTYHWVQSTGNCTNTSWNVLEDSLAQVAALALFHDFFECAEQKKKNAGGSFAKLVKKFLIRSLGHCAW